jgi:hypothetical protein
MKPRSIRLPSLSVEGRRTCEHEPKEADDLDSEHQKAIW